MEEKSFGSSFSWKGGLRFHYEPKVEAKDCHGFRCYECGWRPDKKPEIDQVETHFEVCSSELAQKIREAPIIEVENGSIFSCPGCGKPRKLRFRKQEKIVVGAICSHCEHVNRIKIIPSTSRFMSDG